MPMTFSRLEALPFGGAHAAEHGVVIHADDEPVLDLGCCTSMELAASSAPGCRCSWWARGRSGPRETGGLERAQGALDPATGGVELVGGDGEHPGRLYVPLALLHLLVELLP